MLSTQEFLKEWKKQDTLRFDTQMAEVERLKRVKMDASLIAIQATVAKL